MGVGPNGCVACVQVFEACILDALEIPSTDARLNAVIECSTNLIQCVLELCPDVDPDCLDCVITFVGCMGDALQESGQANQLRALLACSIDLIGCVLGDDAVALS